MPSNLFDLFDSSIKDGKNVATSSPTTLADLTGSSAIASDSIRMQSEMARRVDPKVDYSDFANFVFFNSAEDYFNISGERILNQFPYDGTHDEYTSFVSSSDAYQQYLLSSWPRLSGCGFFSTSASLANSVPYAVVADIALVSGSSLIGSLDIPSTGAVTFDWKMNLTFDSQATPRTLFQKVDSSGNLAYGLYTYLTGTDVHVVLRHAQSDDAQSYVTMSLPSSSIIGARRWVFSVDRSATCATTSLYVSTSSFDPVGSSWSFVDSSNPTLISRVVSTGADYNPSKWVTSPGAGNFYVGSGSIGTTTSSLVLSGCFPLEARVSEFRVWRGAKSEEDIRETSNTRVFKRDDLLAYWRFAEGYSGSVNNPSFARTIRDYSGHDLNMSLVNLSTSGTRFWQTSLSGGSIVSPQDDGEIVMSLNDQTLISFITLQQTSGSSYDRQNNGIITDLVPSHFIDLEDRQQTKVMRNMLYLLARQFDEIKVKIDHFTDLTRANYTNFDQVPDALLGEALQFWGWTPHGSFISAPTFQYFFGEGVLSGSSSEHENQRLDTDIRSIKNEFWRRTLVELPYLYKTKGTRESVESLMRVYGLDSKIVKLKEFGMQPNVAIQTKRIASQKSFWSLKSSGTFASPNSTVDSPTISVTSGSDLTVEFDVRFLSESKSWTSPTPRALYSIGDPNDKFNVVETLRFQQGSLSTSGTVFYTTISGTAATATFANVPLFDGEWNHLTVTKSSGVLSLDVRRLDEDVVVHTYSSSSSYIPVISSSYTLRLNPCAPFVPAPSYTGSMWVRQLRNWKTTLTETEMQDHALNMFSYGTDDVDRQNDLLFAWTFDETVDSSISGAFDSSLNSRAGSFSSSFAVASYEKFFGSYNFIAPPDYGWNEEKIRSFDSNKSPDADGFAESSSISVEFNLIDALNEDISYMLSSMDNWNNIIGDAANRYRDSYQKLDSLRRQYFLKLTGRINFRVFADFLDFFDRSFLELIKRLLPARARFKGADFVVESHMLERPKVQYFHRRREPDAIPEGTIKIFGQ